MKRAMKRAMMRAKKRIVSSARLGLIRGVLTRGAAWGGCLWLAICAGCRQSSESSTHTAASPEASKASHQKMEEVLERVRVRLKMENPYVGTRQVDGLRAQVAQFNSSTPDSARFTGFFMLGRLELLQGNEAAAINAFRIAEELFPKVRQDFNADDQNRFWFELGVAYLRLGETQNCCARSTPESCIVPIAGEAIHTQPEGSQRAAEYFLKILRNTPPDDYLHRTTLWLLNIAKMTLDEYPEGVPSEFLIPESAFATDQEFPRFPNVAKSLGLDTFSLAGGAICDDFDNDGLLDVVAGAWDPTDHIRIFWNRDGKFVEGAQAAGLENITGGLNMVQTDYNNDGWIDLFVLRGGWLALQGRIPNSLLRNNGDGTFTDVTYAAGLAEPAYPTQTAAWADYDLDGDLDVYIGNESMPGNDCPSQLFRNNGDGTFTDVAAESGVLNGLKSKGVAWGDFDGDRYPDLYVSNYAGANRLYRNLGNGKFRDVAESLHVADPFESFPVWFWDYNNDGALDLYVSAYSGGVGEIAANALGKLDPKFPRTHLYRNDGRGSFENVAPQLNLVKPHHPMGANFGDLDNDGFLDFYVGTGWPEYHQLMPNAMYRNDRGERFLDVTTAGGFGHLQKGHGVAFADLDRDGDADIFEQMGGFYRGDRFYDVLFQNPGFGNHWVALKLAGTQSNRAAIGTRIRIDVTESGEPRSIYRWVDSGGSFGGNPFEQLIGIGRAEQIDSIEIFWPKTGETQRFTNVAIDRIWRIVEGQTELQEVPRKALRWPSDLPSAAPIGPSPPLPPAK